MHHIWKDLVQNVDYFNMVEFMSENEMTVERFKQSYNKLPHVIKREEIDTQIENTKQEIIHLIDMLENEDAREHFKKRMNSIIC